MNELKFAIVVAAVAFLLSAGKILFSQQNLPAGQTSKFLLHTGLGIWFITLLARGIA